MSKPRLVVTRRLPDAVLERAARDYDAWLNMADDVMPPDQLVARCQGVDALLFSLSEPMTKALVDRLPASVKVAATYSVGTDHIDVAAARRRGLKIGNAPHGVTIATAEIAMLLILGAARRAPEGERMVREDRWLGWRPTEMLGMRLDGKSLGIVGMGKIGRELAKRARAFGMVIHYHNRARLALELEQGALYHPTLESLCRAVDIVSINAPSKPETKNLVNARSIGWMKPGVILVNTARGDLVDEGDLIEALRSGRVGYAGIDVFRDEPAIDARWKTIPNTFLLPHWGSATLEARDEMGFEALDNIDAYFAGRPLPFEVC